MLPSDACVLVSTTAEVCLRLTIQYIENRWNSVTRGPLLNENILAHIFPTYIISNAFRLDIWVLILHGISIYPFQRSWVNNKVVGLFFNFIFCGQKLHCVSSPYFSNRLALEIALYIPLYIHQKILEAKLIVHNVVKMVEKIRYFKPKT